MGLLESRLGAALDKMFDEAAFGETVTYLRGGSDPLEVAAVVDRGEMLAERAEGFRGAMATVFVREEDVPQPGAGDKIRFSGRTWTVDDVSGPAAGVWTLKVRADVRTSFRE